MSKSQEYDKTWDSIYARGEQLNLYPYDSVVTFLMRNFGPQNRGVTIRVLEIGCGAGNNLWFAAREGFEVFGLDASECAIKFARKRFESDALNGDFEVGSFTDLPYKDNQFDVIIDRAASTNVNLSVARKVNNEVSRVLNSGGLVYSEVFSDQASSRGKKLDDGVMTDIKGPYSGAGNIYFYSKSELENIYKQGWQLQNISHTERKEYSENGNIELFAHWSITAKKN